MTTKKQDDEQPDTQEVPVTKSKDAPKPEDKITTVGDFLRARKANAAES